MTELAQEKFDVWTWKAVHGRETQRRVLCDDRAPDLQETDLIAGTVSKGNPFLKKQNLKMHVLWGSRGGGKENKRQTSSAARLHFSLAISCVVPCISATVFSESRTKKKTCKE